MHARSALFDAYGDHLLGRGGIAPVAALIRLLGPLEIRPPAVRTAISRMVAQGWLSPCETEQGPGYRLTDRAVTRLRLAAARIYRVTDEPWDGTWHLHVLAPIPERSQRERVRNQLRFLGLAPISDSTWVSPRAASEVTSLLAEEGLRAVTLTSCDVSPVADVLEAFEVDRLGEAYADWLAGARRLVEGTPVHDDEQAYVVRSQLLHEWRKFLFTDPGLPPDLLPRDWPGRLAARYFGEQATRLLPAASRFVDACLDPSSTTDTDTPGGPR